MALPPEFGERFLPLRQVEGGGMAEIWLVEDLETGGVKVAKVLPEGAGSQTLELLRREFHIGQGLDHPNIVGAFELHDEAARPFLLLEYVGGSNAGALAGRPMNDVLAMLADVARALQYVHDCGVVHRDLKPSNILLDEAGRPHITDFGIADFVETRRSEPPLAGGGSRATVSPQQLDGAPASIADDLYSFGALAQQLVTGSPPLGQSPSDQQIRMADPRLLEAGWPVPSQLQDLVSSLLAKDPEDRPRDMAAVARTLDTILSAEADRTTPPRNYNGKSPARISPPPRAESIRPMSVAVGGTERAPARTRRLPPMGWSTAAAFAVLAAILAFVVFVLPGIVDRKSTPTETVPPSDASPRADNAEAVTQDPATRADEERSQFSRQRQVAEAMGAPDWAKADFLNAISRGEDGEALFNDHEFERAAAAYAEATTALDGLVERGTEVLAQALSDGERALESGDSAAAIQAFERALAIDSENAGARGGLARAEVQDDVLALLEQGARKERVGDHGSAAADYRSALALDPGSADAKAGADRASRAVAHDAFSSAMSKGLTSLERGEYSDARAAFFEARGLRPDAPEVTEGLQRVDRAERRQTLSNLRRRAEDAERKEDWRTAAGLYDQVLEVDSNLAFAVAGAQRSAGRIELSSRIEFHLAHPERLVSDDVLADADALLAAARRTEPRGPEINRQTTALEQLVADHSAVVPVSFRSDNLTDVVIYKVGRLGSFTAKTLEMRPGTYTVVGSRPGYRDVRIQLRIRPGAEVPPVVVRCEETV